MNFKLQEMTLWGAPLISFLLLGVFFQFIIHDCLTFLAFLVFFVFLPSYTFSKWFLTLELTPFQRMCLGYPVTLATLFLLTWFGSRIGFWQLPVILVGVGLYGLWDIFRDGKNRGQGCGKAIVIPACISYFFCAGFMFMLVSKSAIPELGGFLAVSPDFYFAMGHGGGAMRFLDGAPFFPDFRFADLPMSYHLLQNIYHGFIVKLTGINNYNLFMFLSPLVDWFFLITAIFIGGRKVAKLSSLQVALLAFLILFSSTAQYQTGGMLTRLYNYPMSLFFGLSSFVLFTLYTYAYLSKRLNKLDVLYLGALFLVMAGTKSSFLALVPLALVPVFVYRLWKKDIQKSDLLLAAAFVGVLLLITNTILPSTGEAVLRNEWGLAPLSRFISNFLVMVNEPLVLVVVGLFVFDRIFRARLVKVRPFIFYTIGMISVAAGMDAFLNLVGGEIYSFWYAWITILILVVVGLGYIVEKRLKIFIVLSCLGLSYGFLQFSNVVVDLTEPSPLSSMKNKHEERLFIDWHEWKAMEWVRQNISPDKVFFLDITSFQYPGDLHNSMPFYSFAALGGLQRYAGFSHWIESGKASINNPRLALTEQFVFSQSIPEQMSILEKMPVDYFIQSLRFNKRDYSLIPGLDRVYANPSVIIYQVVN